MDALTGGLPRGCLTEICGAASSGRTSVLLATLAAASRRQETCALVDVSDAFDPTSAARAGVRFERLLWVRCGGRGQKSNSPQRRRVPESKKYQEQKEGPVEQALRVTDLLLQSGGFGMVVMDLGDVPFASARRVPLTSWFRFQRAVEHTPTVLMTCASLLVQMKERSWAVGPSSLVKPTHAQILDELPIEGELLRSRLERKPVRSVMAAIMTKAVQIS
jgi:hypothetical protein